MIPTDTPCIKGTDSIESKPATIVYHPPGGRGPRVGAATHHIVTSDEELHVYLGDRRDGIDSTLPLNRCEIHRTDRGRETFGADVDARAGDGFDDTEDDQSGAHADGDGPELVTDGGTVVETGDVVTVRDEDRSTDPGPWKVKEIQNGEARLWSSMQPFRHEPISDLTVVTKAEDTTLPHGVPDQDDDDSGSTVMTDGGHVIKPGDVVSHASEQYRVGCVGETNAELYRLGETSIVAALSDVEIVPGAVAVDGGDR